MSKNTYHIGYYAREYNGAFHSQTEGDGFEIPSNHEGDLKAFVTLGNIARVMSTLKENLGASSGQPASGNLLLSVYLKATRDDGSVIFKLPGLLINVPGSPGVAAVQQKLIEAAGQIVA